MDIEAKIDAIRGGHLHVIAQLSIGETMDICSRLRAYEKELADLRAYKQSAEAKLKEYEQATKLSGEVNARLVRELLEMQDKVAAMESQKPAGKVVKWLDSNTAICSGEGFAAAAIDADLYFKPVPADKPAVDWPQINELITGFIDDYHYAGDGGYYCPTEWEKALITDCIVGLLDELPLKPAVAVPDSLSVFIDDKEAIEGCLEWVKSEEQFINVGECEIDDVDTHIESSAGWIARLLTAMLAAAPSHSKPSNAIFPSKTASEFISIKERMPEIGEYVLLMTDRYWSTPDGVPDMRVAVTGYLADLGGLYWYIFGERGMKIDAFTHWMPINTPKSYNDEAEGA